MVRLLNRGLFGLLLIAAAIWAGLGPASARPLTDAEKSGLADAVKAFDTAMHDTNVETIIAVIPPKVMNAMATKYGVPVEQLKTMVVEQTKAALATVKFESFGMDLDKASYLETADGTPYALIPTETVMVIGDSKMKAEAATLAILDEGAWYLLRVSEKQQVEMFKSVYPSFVDVELPEGTLESVK